MTPTQTAAPTLWNTNPATDRALADTAHTSGAFLAGLIAAAMLDTAGQPDRLPELMFPDLDPNTVRRVWNTALTVGYRAGRLASPPRLHRDTLHRLQAQLADAGWACMARAAAHTARSAAAEPARHHEHTPFGEDDTRGGHW